MGKIFQAARETYSKRIGGILMTSKEIAADLIEWIDEAEHYSVVHYAVERGMSKEELFRKGGEDAELGRALDYALSVQEYKIADGGLNKELDRVVVLKMLETYHGWKGDGVILQKNEYKQYMNEAESRAKEISAEGRDNGVTTYGGRIKDVE